MAENEIYVLSNGKKYNNIEQISIHASLDALPRSFDISYIDYAGQILKSGSNITIGTTKDGKLFSNAYAEKISKKRTATSDTMQMSGRGHIKDLLDGSANIRSSQLPSTIDLLAKFLCDAQNVPYKNLAKKSNTNNLTAAFSVGCDESAFAILERAARYEAVIIYDSWDGSFVINDVASKPVTTIRAEQVTDVAFNQSVAERYYSYSIVRNQNSAAQEPGQTPIVDGIAYDPEKDTINPSRKLTIINSKSDGTVDFSQRLAEWYANRAYGKSTSLEVTIPSWTYETGKYWDINMLVNVDIPGYYQTTQTKKALLISEVTLSFSIQNGTEAMLRLTLPDTYSPQPLDVSQTSVTNAGNNNNYIGVKSNTSDG